MSARAAAEARAGAREVLVADDSATVRALVSAAVRRWGFTAVQASDGEDAWSRLQAPGAPRLALIDWEMPGMDGLEVCRLVRGRESGGATYTYLLLLTGRRDTVDLVAGMEAGADDYIAKPFEEHELRVRLRAGERVVALQSELYRMKELFRLQSRTDPITGSLNRRAIMERLASELVRTRRSGGSLGLAIVDVDHFKRVNDTLGHAAGDAALCELVARLERAGRASDTFGRIGGEEFLVIWPGADASGALAAGERLRRAVGAAPFALGGSPVGVTVSVGVTATAGGEPADVVLARADAALYAAKRGGRDRVEAAPAAEEGRSGAARPAQEPAPSPSAPSPWLARSE